jgi:hypothetical protein
MIGAGRFGVSTKAAPKAERRAAAKL